MDSYIKFFLTNGFCGQNVSKLFIVDGKDKQTKILPSPHHCEEKVFGWVLARLVFLFSFVREGSQAGSIRNINIERKLGVWY